MKIKRYLDKDMRHVLRQVREDQGPDAVILSNRRVSDGIEVIAAIDYDEALVKTALTGSADAELSPKALARLMQDKVDEGQEPMASSAEVLSANLKQTPSDIAPAADLDIEIVESTETEPESFDASLLSAKQAAELTQTEESTNDDSQNTLLSMQEELTSLRGLLETQLSGLVWKDATRRFPQRVQILRNLAQLGIAPDVANIIVDGTPPVDKENLERAPLMTLAQMIPVAESRLLEDGGIAALIGPTGVGKTTTIAKIAAQFAMQHGAEEIALVSADAYRIGAREHLKAFANIIGVSVHSASSSEELHDVLARLATKKLVLIDTEGRSQRDRELANRMAAYGSHADRVHFYLTLSAATQEAGLDEVIRTFNQVPLAGCIVTKIDEAAQLGCALSALIRHDLPVAWLSDGQRIPDDLHAATRKRLWMVNEALECAKSSQPRIDEHTMAENYSQASTAHG
ncbi:MAG: flagellar biosynthesis protein FlhF [Woeseiaceae bacterium]|nr:flagellar biosynthesis protein FlhF [Woeseiaceae bacterium]